MTEYYHGQDHEELKCPICDLSVILVDDPMVDNERKSHYKCSFCGREFDLVVRAINFFYPREEEQ
jgi:transposase-like protein